MTDLNKTILQKASGETRINPDEQRLYMGTFRERVLLVLSFEEAVQPQLQQSIDRICQDLKKDYPHLFLKISPKLSDSLQIHFMKKAQSYGITSSIIDEKDAASPFALLFHTDHAVNLETISLQTAVEKEETTIKEEGSEKKTSFWQKLFGK